MRYLVLSLAFVLAGALAMIYLNSQLVELRHLSFSLEKQYQAAQSENAGFKEQIFQALDSDRLVESANQLGLVEERKPTYFNAGGGSLTRAD
jgi:cell division protein FtsL